MSGEDHNDAVAHAATGVGETPDKEKKRGGRREEEWCWMCTWRPRRKEKGGGARWKNRVHLTSLRLCSSHATMPCCCVRSGWGWLLCASMSMPMRGNVMCDISCHQHHDDELIVCQCVLQPAIPLCVCVCVCAEGTPVQAAGRRAHTPKKEERRESVCERRKRETAGQMNQPTNQPSEATSMCV